MDTPTPECPICHRPPHSEIRPGPGVLRHESDSDYTAAVYDGFHVESQVS